MHKSRYELINTYLNKGIIEAYMQEAKEMQTPLCLAQFDFEVDLEDGFFFKNIMTFMQNLIHFAPVLQYKEDTFIILFRHTNLHEAKKRLKNLEHTIRLEFKHELRSIGLTLFDASDTYHVLLNRLERYYTLSRLSLRKKIFFGTIDFDLHENANLTLLLNTIFRKENKVTLHNLYKGMPLQEEAIMAKFEGGVAQLKVASPRISFYEKESFTIIQHDKIPYVIKAKIIKVDPQKSLLVLNRLELLEYSALDRTDIRLLPHKNINAILSYQKIKCFDGVIANISESSVVLHVKMPDIEKLLQKGWLDQEFEIAFQLPTSKGFLTPLNAKANILNIVNETIVLSLQPNSFMKSKLKTYITLLQNRLLVELKQHIRNLI
ncbi:hypothetical protein [Sulfurospirillum barnesii]|uniref:PilZ domain-containing protein n=1 Tax=Sulfurospirillum barnesii (strain ATCC 700032 / DSM 10660 / SES-3) TaxID=760154 RepID=I3XZ50_SULBS|nr:hypothetical protein [Sulfurospirillum barnesii]AFL69224.1 hypothetical protein Sulba_1945 [Sulfurospirillum barnesii SES-3]